VLSAGEGAVAVSGDEVTAHYTGTLLNGHTFDSSRTRGEPISFTLGKGRVIACWDTAFQSMRVGERAFITCASSYAYGNQATGSIPADSTLQFDVEFVSVKKASGGDDEEL
jgi:FKBP-type peptidyl-prolyl cis-trans isomerase